jgi:hypothetical protein
MFGFDPKDEQTKADIIEAFVKRFGMPKDPATGEDLLTGVELVNWKIENYVQEIFIQHVEQVQVEAAKNAIDREQVIASNSKRKLVNDTRKANRAKRREEREKAKSKQREKKREGRRALERAGLRPRESAEDNT